MQIEKYTLTDIQKEPELMKKVSTFIYETFSAIEGLYDPNMPFYKEIKEGPDIGNLKDETNRFYLIKNTEEDIIACMWGTVKEINLNPKMGDGGAYYSKYLASAQKYQRQGLASLLKKEFEKEAKEYTKVSKKPALVISGVLKNNDVSRQRNLSNGYQEWINPTDPNTIQYYKEYYPEENKN